MVLDKKIVDKLPVKELFKNKKSLTMVKEKGLSAEQISDILKNGPIEFVIADVGKPYQWLSKQDCYSFWKNEVKQHLSSSDKFNPQDYPQGYVYIASEWEYNNQSVILLEVHH